MSVIQKACHRLMMIEASYFLQIEVKNLPKYLKVHPEIVKNLKSHLSVPADIVQLHVDVLPLDTKTVEKSQKIKELVAVQGTLTLTLSPHGAREIKEQKQYLLPPGGGGLRWGGELLQELYGFLTNDALTFQFMKDHNFVHLASNDDDFTEWIG